MARYPHSDDSTSSSVSSSPTSNNTIATNNANVQQGGWRDKISGIAKSLVPLAFGAGIQKAWAMIFGSSQSAAATAVTVDTVGTAAAAAATTNATSTAAAVLGAIATTTTATAGVIGLATIAAGYGIYKCRAKQTNNPGNTNTANNNNSNDCNTPPRRTGAVGTSLPQPHASTMARAQWRGQRFGK